MARDALFAGLIFDEQNNPVTTTRVGDDAFYVVDDEGFMRHIEAEAVDRQILAIFLEQLQENKEIALDQAMRMLGKDDIFTKAALDAQMRSVNIDQILQAGIPEQARNMMGMVGFRVAIDVHGNIVRIDQPSAPEDM